MPRFKRETHMTLRVFDTVEADDEDAAMDMAVPQISRSTPWAIEADRRATLAPPGDDDVTLVEVEEIEPPEGPAQAT